MKIYHYTKDSQLEKILGAGFIEMCSSLAPIPDLVWMTSEKFIPNLCRPQDHTLSPARFLDVAYYRFEFDSSDPGIKAWFRYQRTIKGGRNAARSLNQRAADLKDNPKRWFISEARLSIGHYEGAVADPEFNFFMDGQSVNYFAP